MKKSKFSSFYWSLRIHFRQVLALSAHGPYKFGPAGPDSIYIGYTKLNCNYEFAY